MSRRRKNRKKLYLFLGVGIFLVLFFLLNRFFPIWDLFFRQGIDLERSEGRVNVLLLGTGGAGHDGPNLTDTMIYASLDPGKKKISLISIPRDLWVPELEAKVNFAYASGEAQQKGGGKILAKRVVKEILGQPVDYVVRVDFDGFARAIDAVGGIEVEVENTLDDYEYPIAGRENDTCGKDKEEVERLATSSSQLEAFPCRYEHVHFDKGLNHMNGEQALRFVRSRHALGVEGSDFSRSKRQEKVINALRDKVLSAETLLNPVKILSLYNSLSQNIDTDIRQDEFDDFIKLAQSLRGGSLNSFSLEYNEDPEAALLITPSPSPEFKNQYVVIPQAGNGQFSDIQNYVECLIEIDNCGPPPKRED